MTQDDENSPECVLALMIKYFLDYLVLGCIVIKGRFNPHKVLFVSSILNKILSEINISC